MQTRAVMKRRVQILVGNKVETILNLVWVPYSFLSQHFVYISVRLQVIYLAGDNYRHSLCQYS